MLGICRIQAGEVLVRAGGCDDDPDCGTAASGCARCVRGVCGSGDWGRLSACSMQKG